MAARDASVALQAMERGDDTSGSSVRDVRPAPRRVKVAALGALGVGCVSCAALLMNSGMQVKDATGRAPRLIPRCSAEQTQVPTTYPMETEAILNEALLLYAKDLKSSIVGAASGMIAGAGGLDDGFIIPEWNATAQDEGIKGLGNLSCPMRSQMVSLFDTFAARKHNFTTDLLQSVFQPSPNHRVPLPVGYVTAAVENWADHGRAITSVGEAVHAQALSEKVVVESGGGFGWGLQIYCGCKLIMATGGGFGFGMVMGNETSMELSGGGGGGGGAQIFVGGKEDAGKDDVPVLNIGGGGGGTLTQCAGSTDFGQLTPVSSMELARQNIVAPQIEACPPRKLSVVGGGGGGMGFTVSSTRGGSVAYGGGLDLRFSSSFAAENDELCDGALLSGRNKSDPDSQAYDQINNATGECRKQCLATASVQQNPASFWKCNCPCQQSAFKALKLPFADYLRCD